MSAASRRWRPRLPSMRIATFIGILHLLIGLLGAGIITAFALYFIYDSGVKGNVRDIEDLALVVENALEQPLSSFQAGQGSTSEIQAVLDQYLAARPDVGYTVLHADGMKFLTSDPPRVVVDSAFGAPEARMSAGSLTATDIRRVDGSGRVILVATRIGHGGAVYGVLVLAAPLDRLMAPTYRTMTWMGVVALLIVAFTVGEGWLGSIYISQPLARLSKVAEALGKGDLTARAEPRGPLEVAHLARTLNVMAERMQRVLDAMRAFVANASHELRTPLTSVKLQVGALRDGAYEDPQVAGRFLGQLESEIDRLVHMVNDMLDLSQIEESTHGVHRQPVDLAELSREVLAFWEARSRQAGLRLSLSSDADLPVIQGDPFRLRQLFDNLLDNAVKNTPPGGEVEIALRRCPAATAAGARDRARVEIRDTGVGIAPEHVAHIFERFYRIEMRRKQGREPSQPAGSGLGLAIARSIALAHGGAIGVESQPGKGSTFWVEI